MENAKVGTRNSRFNWTKVGGVSKGTKITIELKPGTLEFDLDLAGLDAIRGPEHSSTVSRTSACAS